MVLRNNKEEVCTEELINRCTENSLLRRKLWLFLYCLNIPLYPRALNLVLNNVEDMLRCRDDAWSPSFAYKTKRWPVFISLLRQKLEDGYQDATLISQKEYDFTTLKPHPMFMAGMVEHPLYACLCNSHPKPERRHQYLLLQARFIEAHTNYLTQSRKKPGDYFNALRTARSEDIELNPQMIYGKAKQSAVDVACLQVRRLCGSPASQHLSKLNLGGDPTDFQLSPLTVERDSLTDTEKKVLGPIATFIEKSYFGNEPKASGSKRRSIGKANRLGLIDYPDDPLTLVTSEEDPEGLFPSTVQLIQRYPGNEDLGSNDNDEGETSNACPYEQEDPENMVRTVFKDERQTRWLDLLMAAKGKNNAIGTANQLLLNQFNVLNIQEVQDFLEWLSSQETDADQPLPPQGSEEKPTTASPHQMAIWACRLMVLLGRDLGYVAELTTLHTEDEQDDIPNAYLPKKRCWRFEALTPDYKTEMPEAFQAYTSQHSRWVYLSAKPTINLFSPLLSSTYVDDEQRTDKLFKLNFRKLRSAVSRLLREYEKANPLNRITITRLSRFLFMEIANTPEGGVLEAAQITGYAPSTIGTQLHYASPSHALLNQLYTSAIQRLFTGLCIPNELEQQEELINFESPMLTGARLHPDQAILAESIETLRHQLLHYPCDERLYLHQSVREYHNLYVSYVALVLSYATGVRALRDPLKFVYPLEHDKAYAIVSDKDGFDPSRLRTTTGEESISDWKSMAFKNTRLIKLPETFKKQSTHYSAHMARIANMAGRLGTWNNAPRLGYLEENLRFIPFSEKNSGNYLKQYFPLPLNVNRHLHRSLLREQGVYEEIVDAQMGHWSVGQAPWHRFSTQNMKEAAERASHHIEQLLADLGLEALPSALEKLK